MGPPSWESSLLGDPGAKFFCEKGARHKSEEENRQKESTEACEDGLKRASPSTLGFFTVPTDPAGTRLVSGNQRRAPTSRDELLWMGISDISKSNFDKNN
jgi:hypothetical protein